MIMTKREMVEIIEKVLVELKRKAEPSPACIFADSLDSPPDEPPCDDCPSDYPAVRYAVMD
jgi:hypothetical protein